MNTVIEIGIKKKGGRKVGKEKTHLKMDLQLNFKRYLKLRARKINIHQMKIF